MADEAHQSTAADEPTEEKTASLKKKSGGFFSRFWRGIFGSKNEDYEKKLQYLSKEEAAVHARLKRRARSSRRRARNIIVISVVLEAIAVIYAIVTTRSIILDWKMRATRVFPIFGLPILATLIYSILVHFTRMLDHKDQKMLEKLRAERQAKIDELKERTNYYTTQQIIQRYDLDPAAKAAAATILASKLGADSGLKVYLGDESSYTMRSATGNDVDLVKSRGLRNRKPSHIRSNSTGNPALTQFIDETSVNYSSDDEESPEQNQKVVEHYKGPRANDGGWLSRIAALLVGEDPTQCYALICGSCHMHNGLVRKEDFPYIKYYCPNCHALNGSQHHDDHISGLSSGIDTPKIAAEVNRETADSSNTLAPIYELPTGDENEGNARTSGSSA